MNEHRPSNPCNEARLKARTELLELAFTTIKGSWNAPSTWLQRTRAELYGDPMDTVREPPDGRTPLEGAVYSALMTRLTQLMEADPEPKSAEGTELNLLATLAEFYERDCEPRSKSVLLTDGQRWTPPSETDELQRLRHIENMALRVASSRRNGLVTDKAVLDKLDAALETTCAPVTPAVPTDHHQQAIIDKAAEDLRQATTLSYEDNNLDSLNRALDQVCDRVSVVISEMESGSRA